MKKLILRTALAASAALAFAGVANASVTVTVNPSVTDYASDVLAVPDSNILWDFDTIFAPGYNYAPLSSTGIGNVSNVQLQPLGDTTVYGTVNPNPGSSPATFTTTPAGLTSFSLLVGSPDLFNRMRFIGLDGTTVVGDLDGSTGLFGSLTPVNGSNIAGRVTYTFSQAIGSVEFYSNVNSKSFAFEFDRISGAVPEPATWAMMLLGFFGLGATLRSRKVALRAA
jgi:hypothetical protein